MVVAHLFFFFLSPWSSGMLQVIGVFIGLRGGTYLGTYETEETQSQPKCAVNFSGVSAQE